MKRAKFLSLLLTFAMLLSLVSVPALAAEDTAAPTAEATETTSTATAGKTFQDVSDHWGKTSVERWAGYGVLNGDETGSFNPDAQMTRAEFATMLVNLMGYTEKAENTFGDVPADAWFADAILKLAAAGVMQGDGKNANPSAPISRQEAAVLLCRAFNIAPSKDAKIDFADSESVASWAADAVAALTERGMIAGVGDNSFAPVANITRASVAKMADNMVGEYVTADKEITGEVKGLVIVAADATVTLKDATVTENIIVAPKAGAAEVAMTGKTTAKDVYIQSAATVKVEDKAAVGTVLMDAPKAAVEVAGKAAAVATTEAAAEAAVTVAKGGSVESVSLAGESAKLDVTGTVKDVEVSESAKGAEIVANSGAKITNVTTSAEDVKVSGKGTVSNVTATGGSADVTTKGTKVTNDGADKVTNNGKDVSDGKTSGGGSSGGSSGGSHSYKYTVSIGSFTGGTVTSNLPGNRTDKDDTDVILTVTPDEQKGSTMPYVLKALTVTKGDTEVSVTDNKDGTHTFKMETAGTYTVNAEFVQPITKSNAFIVKDQTGIDEMKTYGYETETSVDFVKAAPWLFIGVDRNADYKNDEHKIKIEDLTIKANGTAVMPLPTNWGASFGSYVTAYVNDKPEGHTEEGYDKLDLAGSAYTFDVSFSYEGADYSFTGIKYLKPGVDEKTLNTINFAGTDISYQAAKGEAITLPAIPEKEGQKAISWYIDGTAIGGPGKTYSPTDEGQTISVEAKYVTVATQTVEVRRNDGDTKYKDTYLAAGVTFSDDNTTFTVDEAKVQAYKADETNKAAWDVISHADTPYVGFEFAAPADAAKLVLIGGADRTYDEDHEFANLATSNNSDYGDIMVVGEDVFYVDYLGMANQNGTALKDASFTYEMDWYGDDGLLMASTLVTINRVSTAKYTVTFKDGSETISTVEDVVRGEKVAKPADPAKAGYVFDKWMDGDAKYDFNTAVTSDLTLSATWKAVATFEAMTDDAYKADYSSWNGAPKTVGDFGEFHFSAPDENNVVKVTGEAKYVAGFTDFGTGLDYGFFYPVMIPVLAKDLPTTPEDAQIGTVGVNNDSKITLKSIIEVNGEKYYTLLITTANKTPEQLAAYHVSVYWNGSEDTKTDYTLDFSAVTQMPKTEMVVKNQFEMDTGTAVDGVNWEAFNADGKASYGGTVTTVPSQTPNEDLDGNSNVVYLGLKIKAPEGVTHAKIGNAMIELTDEVNGTYADGVFKYFPVLTSDGEGSWTGTEADTVFEGEVSWGNANYVTQVQSYTITCTGVEYSVTPNPAPPTE